MFSIFMVTVVLYQSGVTTQNEMCPEPESRIPPSTLFRCPENCECDEPNKKIFECRRNSTKSVFSKHEYQYNAALLKFETCHEEDFNLFTSDGFYYPPNVHLECESLTTNKNKTYSKCRFSGETSGANCIQICSECSTSEYHHKCLCFKCGAASTNPTQAAKSNGTSNIKLKSLSAQEVSYIIVIAAISIAAFLINFIVMVKLCCSKLTVIDLFGTALTLFNVLLSIYGMSMALYIFRPSWHGEPFKYCKFFTSIKLFSLGAGLYSLTLLVFHHPIRRSVDDNCERSGEKDEKENEKKKRDAIFKGIVFILEGVMLAGVLGVLSWIKFNNWDHFCGIIKPYGSVEELLYGIEVWYYVLAGLLVSWYFGNFVHRQYLILKTYRENTLRKKNGEEEEELKYVAPYIVRDFPLFIMVTLSFIIWVGGYVVIILKYEGKYERYSCDRPVLPAVIRICSVILPLVLQPFIYIIRNTCCCTCCQRLTKKGRLNNSEDMRLECKCSGDCTCTQCEMDEYSHSKNNNLQVTRFGTGGWLSGKDDGDKDTFSDGEKDDEKTALTKKEKDRPNTFDVPKVVCRSPVQAKSDEKTRLLDDMDGKQPPTPTIVIDIEDESELLPIDEKDEDGRAASRGPTFYPIAEKESETLKSNTDLSKNPSGNEKDGQSPPNNADDKYKQKNPTKPNPPKSSSSTSLESDNTFSRSDSSVSSSPKEEHMIPTQSSNPSSTDPEKDRNKHNELNAHLNNDCDSTGEGEPLLNSNNTGSPPLDKTSNKKTLDSSNHNDVYNKSQPRPGVEVDSNSNHTPHKKPLRDEGTIER